MTLVELSRDAGVATLTLNSPERLNALTWPLLEELRDHVATLAGEAADGSGDVRAVVVTGAGRAFCSGADLDGLFGDRTRPVQELADHLRAVYACFLGLRDLPLPTIAAVQGPAVGAGLNIALACDVIVAGPRAGFGPTFTSIGLHPGGGCTWMLTQRIGTAQTAALLYSGEVVDADRAVRIGLAQELAEDPLARAHELATRWAGHEPSVMRDLDASLRVAATSTAEESLAFEATAQARSLTTDTFEEFARRFQR